MEDKMVELARFGNSTEAEMLVNLLRSEGIDCYVREALLSQVFNGYAGINDAKVELLEKDLKRAQQIMRDYGYEITNESEDFEIDMAEYKKNKAEFSKKMIVIVICLLVILALIIFVNKFYT
jgi:hypothetical protein